MTCGCRRWVQVNVSSERAKVVASRGGFACDYRRELMMDGPIDARSKTIKNHGQKFTLRLIKKLARRGTSR